MSDAERLLVLLRHGQSEWNLKNLFTGWRDVDLSPTGVEEAKEAGRRMKAHGLVFDLAFTSALIRAQHTLALTLAEMGQTGLPEIARPGAQRARLRRPCGLNKDDARKKWGEEQVHKWRRSYDVQPPGGESLKDTVARALPYYCQHILPAVLGGKRVLVAAHGNSLRALVMVLDRLTPATIPAMELATGVPLVYRLNADSTVASKEVLTALKLSRRPAGLRRSRLSFVPLIRCCGGRRYVGKSGSPGRGDGGGVGRRLPASTNFWPRRRSISRWSTVSTS